MMSFYLNGKPKRWTDAEFELAMFRLDRYEKGFDPDLIGEHEVKPVRCPCCGHAIPWALIKGYRE